jgi:hypothetical protein
MKTILHLALAILTCASLLAAEIETAADRAQRIEIPRVDFRETALREACEFLSQKSRQLNPKRVNIIIDGEVPGRITLRLEKRPLLVVIREATAQVGCEVQEEPYALVIRAKGAPKLPAVVAPKGANLDEIRKRLDQIVIPKADFRETKLEEAIEFLGNKNFQLNPENAVNVVLRLDDHGGGTAPAPPAPAGIPGLAADPIANAAPISVGAAGRRINLICDDVPLLEVLRYTAGLAGLEIELTPTEIVIRPPHGKPKAR